MNNTFVYKTVLNDELYKQHKAINILLNYTNKVPECTAGINCSHQIDIAENEFNFILNYYQKEPARYVRHHVISSDVIKDPFLMLQIAYNIASFFASTNQVFIAVHTDKEHIHAHLVVNTVSCYTGKIFSYDYNQEQAFYSHAKSFGYYLHKGSPMI